MNALQSQLDSFNSLERQFEQKMHRLQYEIDSMELQKEKAKEDILHCELMINHLKRETDFAKSQSTTEVLSSKLDTQNYHLENLKEMESRLELEIGQKLQEMGNIILDHVDDLERALDGRISFWKYFYPTVFRYMAVAFLISSLASYLYNAVGVSIELRLGGDDDEEEGDGADGEEKADN